MKTSNGQDGSSDDLLDALRRLRRLEGARDRTPRGTKEHSDVDKAMDVAQRETWRLASTRSGRTEPGTNSRMSGAGERLPRHTGET